MDLKTAFDKMMKKNPCKVAFWVFAPSGEGTIVSQKVFLKKDEGVPENLERVFGSNFWMGW